MLPKLTALAVSLLCCAYSYVLAEESPKITLAKEGYVQTHHTMTINQNPLSYESTAGNLQLKDEQGKVKANLFFVAYTKEGENPSDRPITFCFNGGPGSASVWLHLGCFGPKRIKIDEQNTMVPPYNLVDNPYCLLDLTDLVFIDPVSTGYSKAEAGEDPKQFHGYEEDIKWVGEFVRLYTTKFDRWNSPKYLAGESYGSTRAAGLVDYLDKEFHMDFNGAILISTALNYQTLWDFQGGNDLPYILYLPSYTAAAWHHKKLPEDLQKDLNNALKQSETYALTDYNVALMKGDNLTADEKEKVITQLSRLTGLSKEYLNLANLRVNVYSFAQELLRDQRKTIGRFDGRFIGVNYDLQCDQMTWDPSVQQVVGPFTAAFHTYVRDDLKWEKEDEYAVFGNVRPWNYSNGNNQYLNVAVPLSEVMSRNPKLKIFVASGLYDLATPYFTSTYTFNHLGIDPSLKKNVQTHIYPAGHMMYLNEQALAKLKQDLRGYYLQKRV